MQYFQQLLKSINIISLCSCFKAVFPSNYYFSGERHNSWELVFVVDGNVGVAEDEKLYELKAGDIIFHKPMEFHRIWSANGTKPYLIIASFTADGFGMDELSKGVFSLNKDIAELITETAETAMNMLSHREQWKNDYISQQLFSNKLERILLYISRDVKCSLSENNSVAAKNYRNIINAMNDNLDKALSIDELAQMTNLSPSNLKKCFQKYSGMGVLCYFNRLKSIKAQNLIKEGYSMREISEMLGYSSASYFSISFKRECGMSPLEYKKSLADV